MSIADELREYINRWTCLTGHRPSAMPVTEEEAHLLYHEVVEKWGVPMVQVKQIHGEGVPGFLGVDLYITPDAKERREQIIARKEK